MHSKKCWPRYNARDSFIYGYPSRGKVYNTVGWDLDKHGSHFYNEKDKETMDNVGCEIPWDIVLNSEAVPSIKDWLSSKGIKLNILS